MRSLIHNLPSWEASGSCQLDVHGQVGCRQRICLHEGFEGPKRTRKKWMIPYKLCVKESHWFMFVSLLWIYHLQYMFFFVYLFIFTYCFYSFICSFVNMWKKPTSPWRVAPWIVDSFQSENSKWEHRLMPDRSRMKDFLYRAPSIRIATSWSCPLLGCSETAFEF